MESGVVLLKFAWLGGKGREASGGAGGESEGFAGPTGRRGIVESDSYHAFEECQVRKDDGGNDPCSDKPRTGMTRERVCRVRVIL